ncbi:hypothetical protein BgiBS90_014502 [Biomphalaria glabrata]|nr:hypothetical protein BgiBS90_014502 [Biomphalaria glabrata]
MSTPALVSIVFGNGRRVSESRDARVAGDTATQGACYSKAIKVRFDDWSQFKSDLMTDCCPPLRLSDRVEVRFDDLSQFKSDLMTDCCPSLQLSDRV